jgi:hypothetical protein
MLGLRDFPRRTFMAGIWGGDVAPHDLARRLIKKGFFYSLNAHDEPRGSQAQNKNAGLSPRRLDCVVGCNVDLRRRS